MRSVINHVDKCEAFIGRDSLVIGAAEVAALTSECHSAAWRRGLFNFPGEDLSNAKPTRSSDPGVLGLLGNTEQGPYAEFRAWQPGRATLTSPAGTWLVRVIVLARRLSPAISHAA